MSLCEKLENDDVSGSLDFSLGSNAISLEQREGWREVTHDSFRPSSSVNMASSVSASISLRVFHDLSTCVAFLVSPTRSVQGREETHLVRAHEVEHSLPRLGHDHVHDLGQVPLDELLVRLSGTLLVEQRVEEVEQVDPRVQRHGSDLFDEAVPQVVAAPWSVLEREGGHLLDGREGRREAGEQPQELQSNLVEVGRCR